jgi:hypothetical protein
VTLHFAQVAFALLAGGAAILVVAGLVLEALHDDKSSALCQHPGEQAAPSVPLTLYDVTAFGASEQASRQGDPANGNERPGSRERGKRRGKDRGASGDEGKAARRQRKHRHKKAERRNRRDGDVRTAAAPPAETSDG